MQFDADAILTPLRLCKDNEVGMNEPPIPPLDWNGFFARRPAGPRP